MSKYEISIVVESDSDYSDGEQIEELRNDLTSVVADYNCFCQIGTQKFVRLSK